MFYFDVICCTPEGRFSFGHRVLDVRVDDVPMKVPKDLGEKPLYLSDLVSMASKASTAMMEAFYGEGAHLDSSKDEKISTILGEAMKIIEEDGDTLQAVLTKDTYVLDKSAPNPDKMKARFGENSQVTMTPSRSDVDGNRATFTREA